MDEVVCFDMDNATVVHCLARPGTSLSESLLSLSEQISTLAASRRISLSGQHLPGVDNEWADALSRFKGSSVEWTLKRGLFAKLCRKWGTPHVDLFASNILARLPTCLARVGISLPVPFTLHQHSLESDALYEVLRGQSDTDSAVVASTAMVCGTSPVVSFSSPAEACALEGMRQGMLFSTLALHAWHFSRPA